MEPPLTTKLLGAGTGLAPVSGFAEVENMSRPNALIAAASYLKSSTIELFLSTAAIETERPLRYTGTRPVAGGWARPRQFLPLSQAFERGYRNACSIRDLLMSSTFDTVANIISETCDIPRDTIKPETHAINDLGIDSLDFLDIAFAIDKAFGIKMPLEQWTQEVNDGKATTDQYFQLQNLCSRIDELVAAKSSA
jgi:acyl carrier protein